MTNLRKKLEAMGCSFVGRNDSSIVKFNRWLKEFAEAEDIDAYINCNDEKTIIDKICEEAAEDGVLSDMELEQIHEEMVDNLYQKQYEEEKREYGYKFIAEHIWNAAHEALENGNLAESIAIGDVYNQWIEVCIKAGVMVGQGELSDKEFIKKHIEGGKDND